MTKTELDTKTEAIITDTKEVIELFRDNINKGQLKQLLKIEKVKALFDRTGLEPYTLTIGSENIEKLSDEQIAIFTNKNWTLA